MITVAQLIAELEKLPPDMPVVTTVDAGHFTQDPQVDRRDQIVYGGLANNPHWHAKPDDPAGVEVVWL